MANLAHSLFDACQTPIVGFDSAHVVIACNPALAALVGASSVDTVIGMTLGALFGNDAEQVLTGLVDRASAEPYSGSRVLVLVDGDGESLGRCTVRVQDATHGHEAVVVLSIEVPANSSAGVPLPARLPEPRYLVALGLGKDLEHADSR